MLLEPTNEDGSKMTYADMVASPAFELAVDAACAANPGMMYQSYIWQGAELLPNTIIII